MLEFDLIRAESLSDALKFLQKKGSVTRVVAGGTDLLVELRGLSDGGPEAPAYVLDISALRELKGIREKGDSLFIGPLVTHREIAASGPVRRHALLLARACSTVGAVQHRMVGTVGGNIINASPAADSVPALVALNAEVTFRSAKKKRRKPLKDIFVKPYLTDIRPDELLTEIRFKKLTERARTGFVKLARRNALAISRMNIAVVVILEKGVVKDVRISPGSTTPLPDRITVAEKVLSGKKPTEELIREAGKKVAEEMIARSGVRWSTPYKEPVIAALVSRALRKALGKDIG